MAVTRNAPFYSCKAGRPDTIQSHRKRSAAMSRAGECGQIWDTENARQRQVNRTSAGHWSTFEPDWGMVDMPKVIKEYNLVDQLNTVDAE